MSDDIKRYPPTPRRLERLRQAGVSPASPAVTAVAVLASGTVLGALIGGKLVAWLQAVMAQDLQRIGADVTQLPGLLAGRLAQGGVVVIAISALGAGVAIAAQAAQGTFPQRSSKQMVLPMSTEGGIGRRRTPTVMLWPFLVGLGAAGVMLATWLREWAAPGASLASAGVLWLKWLAVLGGVAGLHAVAVRLRTLRRAEMSHREMLEERRETEGSWLKRRRVNQWLRRRR